MDVILTKTNGDINNETNRLFAELKNIFATGRVVERRGRSMHLFIKEEVRGASIIVKLEQMDRVRRRLVFLTVEEREKEMAVSSAVTFFIVSYNLSTYLDRPGKSTPHSPELVLSNFAEEDDFLVGRITALFHKEPEFRGRQVVSFTKKEGFLFCRKYRYIINVGEVGREEEGRERVRFQEIGPRMTLKVVRVQREGEVVYTAPMSLPGWAS